MILFQPSLVSTEGHQRTRHCFLLVHEVGRSITPIQTREERKAKWGVGKTNSSWGRQGEGESGKAD